MKTITIWQMRPHFFADGMFGARPKVETLSATHAKHTTLKLAENATLRDVLAYDAAGETMSRGDVIVDADGFVHLVGNRGFQKLEGRLAA